MEDIFAKLYDMTAFSNIIADPSFLIMYAIAMPFSSAWITPMSPPGKLAMSTPKAMGTSNSGS